MWHITPQGVICFPNDSRSENLQILTFVEVANPMEIITIFEKDYLPDVKEKGFTEE